MLIEKGERVDVWRLYISNGYHNHKSPEYQHGHDKVSRLTDALHARVKELYKAHVKMKQILNLIRR